jgi:hypothetical protein
MQDEPIGARDPLSDPRLLEHLTLHLLLDSTCSPIWTVDEIARVLRGKVEAADAIAELESAGLIHLMGEFVFPTQAAIHCCRVEAVV